MAAQIEILPKRQSDKTQQNFKLKINTRHIIGDITIAQQSFPPPKSTQYYFPVVDVSQRFEESLERCRKKRKNRCVNHRAIDNVPAPKQIEQPNNITIEGKIEKKCARPRYRSESVETYGVRNTRRASELVDQLLLEIYGRTEYICDQTGRIFETEYGSSTSIRSVSEKFDEKLQYSRLILKNDIELRVLIGALRERVTYSGSILVKQLKRRDALKSKQEKMCNVITAHLQACSRKRSEDTNMRFSPTPVPGDSGFNQWRDAMKMVAKLPGGIPPEFRRKLWLELSEKYLQSKNVNWNQTERLCFNEWSNPDDNELGVQIVKDLHRTGCSLFCGAAGQENQALLKRVLLAYARWNKSVGYCQGFNMLAALILQVMDKSETDSVKVMIYLIEGVLPESYFANNLRGLSVDMVVFRDLLKMRLPQLSKHLEALQNDAREGNSYEPPLTNVFTMQWFLTLFCNCLPQSTVLRVWDLIFLEGNEILLRTAIAIWEKLSDRILAVNSADEFYSIMGVLTREMLEFGLVDSNTLVKSIVAIGACAELNEMRDRYLYNITPWTQSVQTAAKKGLKLFYSDDDDMESDNDEKAAVTAAYGMTAGRKRERRMSATGANLIQPYAHGHPDRERLALDISALKKQYARLRERQRQAHIILQAACARQPIGPNPTPAPIAMNHLLLGKNAIVNSRGRRLGPPKGAIPPARKIEPVKKNPQGETVHWKDTAKIRYPRRPSYVEEPVDIKETFTPDSDSSSYSDDDGSSTSTELCDEPDRLDDFDSDDKCTDTSKTVDRKSRSTSKETKISRNRNKTILEKDDAIKDSDTTLAEVKTSDVVDSGVNLRNTEEIVNNCDKSGVINENILVKINNLVIQTEEVLDIEANEVLDNETSLQSQYPTLSSDNNEETNNQILHSQNQIQTDLTLNEEIKTSKDSSRDPSQYDLKENQIIEEATNTLLTLSKCEEISASEDIKSVSTNITLDNTKNAIEDSKDSSTKFEDPVSEFNTSESQNFFTFDNSSSHTNLTEESPVSSYNLKDNWSNIDDSSLIVEPSLRTLHFSDQASSFEDNPLSYEESQEKKYDQPNLLSFEDQIEGKQTTVSPGKSYSSELISNFEEHVMKQEENDRNEVVQVENIEEIQTELKSNVSSTNEIDDSVNETSKDKSSDFDSFMEERFANQTSEDISCDFDSFLEERVTNQKLEEKTCDFDSFLEERVKILKQNTTPSPQEEVTFTWKLNEEKLRRHKSYEETLKTDISKSFIYKQKSFDINASPETETTQWEPFQFNTKEKKIVVEETEIKNETKNNASLILLSPERVIVETPNITTIQSTCDSTTFTKDDAKKGTNTVISPQSEDCLEFCSNIDKITNVISDFKISSIVNTEIKPLINSSEEIITSKIKLVQDTTKEEKQKEKICTKDDSKSSNSQIEDTILEISPLQSIHGAISKEEIKNVEENSKPIKITRSFENVETLVSGYEDIITEQELKEEICSITLTSESPNTTEGNQIQIDVRFFEDKSHAEEIRIQSIVRQPSVELLTVEDKRLEAGRRNSERALKIIQENSVILHRILQHQRSSEVEDSEEELSKSPISKTFLRSESLLSKTDDDRSSKDEDDLSGTESYSVSPANLDEDLDKSPKRDTGKISPEKVTSLSEEIDLTLRKETFSKSKSSSNNTDKVTSETFTTLSEELSSEIVLQIRNEAYLKSPRIEENIIKSPEIDINADRSPQKLISLNEEIANESDSKLKIEAYVTSSSVVEEENKFLKGSIHKAELPSKLDDFSEDLLTKQKVKLGNEDYSKVSSIYEENDSVKIDIHKAGSSESLTEAKEIDRIKNETVSKSIEEKNKRDVSPKKLACLSKEDIKENNFQIRDDECSKTPSIEANNKSSEKDIEEAECTVKSLGEETEIKFRNETFTKSSGTLDDHLDKTAKREKYENEEQSKQNEYQVKNIISEEDTKLTTMITEDDFQTKSPKQGKCGDDNLLMGNESHFQKYSTDKIELMAKGNELDYLCRSKSPTKDKYEAKAILKDNESQIEKNTKPDESQLENVIQSDEVKIVPKDKEDEFLYSSKSPKTGNYATYDEIKSLSKDKKDEFFCRSKSPKHDKYDTEEIGKITKSTENYTASKSKEDDFLYRSQSPKTNKYTSEELGKMTTFEEKKSLPKDKEDTFLCRSKSPKHDKYGTKELGKFTKSEDNTMSKSNEEYLLYKSPKKDKYDGEDILKENKSHLQQITKPEEYKSVAINNDEALPYRSKSPKPKIYDSGEKEAKKKYGDEDMLKEKESYLLQITKPEEHKSISKDEENEDFRYRNKSPKKDKFDNEENIAKKKDGEHEYLYKRKYETLRNPFSPIDEPSKIATSMYVSPSKHSTKDRFLISPENEASQISPYSSPSKYSSSSKSSAEERRDSLSSYGKFQSFQEDEPVSSFQRSKEYKKRATSFDSNEFELERYSPSKFRSKYTSLGSPVEESSNEEKYTSLDGDRKSSNFKFLDDTLEFSKENIKHRQFESSGRPLNLSSKDVKEDEKDTFRKNRSKSPEEGSSKEPFVSSKRHLRESSDFEFNTKYRSEITSHEVLNTSRYNSPGRSLESQQSPKHLINEDSEIFESPRRHLNDDKQREKSPTHLRKEELLTYKSPRRQFDDILKEDNQSDIQGKYSPKHLAKEELSIYESPRRHYENISKLGDKQKEDIPKHLTKDDTTNYEPPRRQLDDISKEHTRNDRSSESRFRSVKEDMCDKYKSSTLEDVSSANETTTNYESPRRKYVETYKDSSDKTEKLEESSKHVEGATKFESPRRKFREFQDDKPSDYDESSKYVREISSEGQLVERSSDKDTTKYGSPRRKLEEFKDDKSSDRFSEFEESSKYVKEVSYSERQLVGSSKEDSSSKYLASTRLRNEEDIDNKPTSTVKNASTPSYYTYADNSSDYHQFNKNNLSIDLASSRFTSAYSPEVSPPKHLSCLQFTTFQTDIPCTSKTLQISPICSKEKSSTSPTKPDPKYLPSFSLPTLSPPRRTVKSPLSPDKTFNPFPVQPTTRQPKDVGIRLGLYKDVSPLKSPAK